MGNKDYYKVDQAARLLGISVSKIWGFIHSGDISTKRFGNVVEIPDSDVERLRTIQWARQNASQNEQRSRETRASRLARRRASKSTEDPDISQLSIPIRGQLNKAGIYTIEDLNRYTPGSLLGILGFENGRFQEVEKLLASVPNNVGKTSFNNVSQCRGTASESNKSRSSSSDLQIHESFYFHKLSTRTRNCLESARILSIEDLRMNSAEDLMSLRGFGSKCLNEVKAFLKAHKLKLNENSTGPWQLDNDLRAQAQLSRELQGTSPPESFEDFLSLVAEFPSVQRILQQYDDPGINSTLDTIDRCQRKVEQQVAEGILDEKAALEWAALQRIAETMSPPATMLSDLLYWARYLVCNGATNTQYTFDNLERALEAPTLDAEIVQILNDISDRIVQVVRGRFSVKEKTLAILGEELAISRERVRQLESEGIARLRSSYRELPLPRIRTAMAFVRTCSTFSQGEICGKLVEAGLVQDDGSVVDFLTIWRAIQPDDQPFPGEILAYAKSELTARQREISGEVRKSYLRQLRALGVVEIGRITSDLEERECSIEDIAAILARSDLQELAPGYWGTTNKKYALHRVAEKMITVCGPLDVGLLHVGLIRHQQRLDREAPLLELTSAALDVHEDFFVDAREIVNLRELGLGAMPTDAEHAWLQAVNSFGPIVHASTIYSVLADEGLNSGLAYHLMYLSELVQPLGDGLYCLPGTRFTEVDLEAGHAQASERWIQRYLKE